MTIASLDDPEAVTPTKEGWLSHRLGLKYDLTLVENLAFDLRMRGGTWRRPDAVLERLGLDGLDRLERQWGCLSDQRRSFPDRQSGVGGAGPQ